jgi:hypothetical protein
MSSGSVNSVLFQANISCALCGMFLPGTCAAICPLAGIFCGTTGYMCLLGKA